MTEPKILSDATCQEHVAPIFRYTFKEEFTQEIWKFSKIHQYDDRHTFKEAWQEWMDIHNVWVTEEEDRLLSLGYEGNVKDKMFRSARYYFRNKGLQNPVPTKRSTYVSIQKPFLQAMDAFVSVHLSLKPAEGFELFCQTERTLLEAEKAHLQQAGMSPENAYQKIKKTYNNRHFIAKPKTQKPNRKDDHDLNLKDGDETPN